MKKIRNLENTHILLWLIKDTCWVLNFKPLGVFMILPTVSMAVYITYLSKSDRKELLHNIAVTCWILANSIWMIGEFFFNDSTRTLASLFFIIGLISVSLHYVELAFKKIND